MQLTLSSSMSSEIFQLNIVLHVDYSNVFINRLTDFAWLPSFFISNELSDVKYSNKYLMIFTNIKPDSTACHKNNQWLKVEWQQQCFILLQ